jgi:hypothetical protein
LAASFPCHKLWDHERRAQPLLTALVRARDDETFAGLLRDGGRALLRDPAGIGTVAFAALGEKGKVAHAAARLLATTLDAARMAEENDLPAGSALLSALAAAVAAHEAVSPLLVPERLDLARAYASAGLVPPPFATLSADAITDHAPDGAAMPDLGEILDPVLRDAGDSPSQAHAALSELLAGLPPDLAALLPTLRKWMPDDPARAAVHAVIRRQMRAGARPSAPPSRCIARPPACRTASARKASSPRCRSEVAARWRWLC